ncbi:MAG: sialate O-acetylesterase, partial [Stenotrophomonas sp.]
VYGEQALAASGPTPGSVSRTSVEVRIAFDGVTGALVATGANGPIGFELCDAEAKHCAYADATLDGHAVVLNSLRAATAARVRYCWADGPVCTLRDSSGAPAGPFELSLTDAGAP